ncbi:MAG: multicopper oxidase domain-containing protein [Gemmatimonadetes bacterium]|nr:multicopper oxidase domain-containing protein [Gemmatimonadota bacterium]
MNTLRQYRRTAGPALAGMVLGVALTCRPAPSPVATPNDFRSTAGRLDAGEHRVALEARAARWFPSGNDRPSFEVAAFGEVGQAPSVPGPLVRVPIGVDVAIALTNSLPDTLLVTGLRDPRTRDTLVVAPGATATTRFRADRPGLYGYSGRTRGTVRWVGGGGGQLHGVIAVDSTGAPPDRIIAITGWSGAAPTGGDSTFVLALNGRMWPHTERMQLAVGDTAHWRVINFAGSIHPMHLHGAYFRVDARGTHTGDTAYTAAQQRLVVTETLLERETMALTWSPERAGRWLFHCHDAFHVEHEMEEELDVAAAMWARAMAGDTTPLPQPAPAAHAGEHAMSGLVIGIDVAGPASAPTVTGARRIDLTVQQREKVYADTPGLGFVLARPGGVPADSITIPGPPIVLAQGEPVAITVHNRLPERTSVHWHGMELESYFDGVGGWSGSANHVAPSIAPRDSFVARFTPPRAGTFIYHSHVSEVRQLSSGMYGPLLVLPQGQRWNPERDHVVMFAVAGTHDTASVVAHHSQRPLRAGVSHRLRFVNIAAADLVTVEALQQERVIDWRVVAKDGADLRMPSAQPARFAMGPGETMDVEVTPARGPLTLRVKSFNNFDLVLQVK